MKENKLALVRIDPRARDGNIGSVWGRAVLVEVLNDEAVIQPMRHRKTEVVELRFVRPWKSQLKRVV